MLIKNLFTIISSLIISSSLFISCGKKCSGEDENNGIIEGIFDYDGFEVYNVDRNGFIIDNNDSLLSKIPSADTSSIDFNRYTLLGLYADGGCRTRFIRTVEPMDALKKYKYHIKVKSCGTCKVLAMSYNIVIVPKLEEDWTVEFEVE